ncbi:MAG: hypothetical protein LBV80_07950 [Deltaproteobacteria bacterium]|jgi:uncharacterized protein YjcR|nr:hypothetical protein [Deltaproteobacteria bacterium]
MADNRKGTRCKATSKRTGKQCGQFVVGEKTVCRWHGGASKGAPKGSKNALKTGEYETIFPESLSVEEQERMKNMNTDALVMLEDEIRLTRIRETRVLQRIAKAREAEINIGKPTGQKSADGRDILHSAMIPIASTVRTSESGNEKTLHSEAHSIYILKLENALTGVQLQLARLIDQKAKLMADAGKKDDTAQNSGVLMVPGTMAPAEWENAAKQAGANRAVVKDGKP